ncbi:MAG: YciI family protein [bacterium]
MRRPLPSSALLVLLLAASCAFAEVSSAPHADRVRYRLALLRRGPSWTAERTPRTDSIQAGHMANIRRMADLGVLLAAGPFENGGALRGVFVFAPGEAALDTLLAGDPAIASGRLACEFHDWWAPRGLGDDYRRRAAEGMRRDSMVTFAFVLLRRAEGAVDEGAPRGGRGGEGAPRGPERMSRAPRPEGGPLVFAGRIEGAGELRAVHVYAADRATAERALAEVPGVRSGRLVPEWLTWWTAWGTVPGY